MTSWPPPDDYVDFIKGVANTTQITFDSESLNETEETVAKTRYAGHCLIWCRANKHCFESVSFKAFLNVSTFVNFSSNPKFPYYYFVDAFEI